MTIGGRTALRVRPHRLRRAESTRLRSVARAYGVYGSVLGKALAGSRRAETRLKSAALVTYNPFVAAFCDAPWIRKVVYFGQDDWATGEAVRPWWSLYREAYARIEERGAAIFVESEELAERVSPRAAVVPNGVIADVGGRVTLRPRESKSCHGRVRSTRGRCSASASKSTWSSSPRAQ